ncbi:MAG TPA: hypothetical protein VFV02_09760 [Acidimicrobiales bacterium]|nr:hypothetical protein [Acidimicrobiales bacterium]
MVRTRMLREARHPECVAIDDPRRDHERRLRFPPQLAAVFAGWVCTVFVFTAVFVGTAGASDNITYTFYGCSGPSGPPPTFQAVKTALPANASGGVSAAAAFRLTDGNAIFVVLSFGQGAFSPPGISHSGNATVLCSVDFTSGTFIVSGILAPPT